MLYGFVMLIGVLLTLMFAFNGALGQYFSAFEVSFLIHFTGLIILSTLMVIRKEKLRLKNIPPWFYLSGVFGAAVAAIDAYGTLSLGVTTYVTLITASQIVFSALVDSVGIGHLEKVPFDPKRIKSLGLLAVGVGIILYVQWGGL